MSWLCRACAGLLGSMPPSSKIVDGSDFACVPSLFVAGSDAAKATANFRGRTVNVSAEEPVHINLQLLHEFKAFPGNRKSCNNSER